MAYEDNNNPIRGIKSGNPIADGPKPDLSNVRPQPATAVNVSGHKAPAAPKPSALDDYSPDERLVDFLERKRDAIDMESSEDAERRKRIEDADKKISGVADMARAISNLFFATKYAPNMYDPANSMSAKTRERYDRAKRERQADEDRWLNYSLMIDQIKGRMADRKAQKEARDLDRSMRERADQRAQEAHDYNKTLWPTKEETEDEKRRLAKAKADKAEADARYAAGLNIAKINRYNRIGAKSGKSGAGYWLDIPGEGRIYYPNATMYNAGVNEWYSRLDLPEYETYSSEDGRGRVTKRQKPVSTQKKAGEIGRAAHKNGNEGAGKSFDVNQYRCGGNGKPTPPPLN